MFSIVAIMSCAARADEVQEACDQGRQALNKGDIDLAVRWFTEAKRLGWKSETAANPPTATLRTAADEPKTQEQQRDISVILAGPIDNQGTADRLIRAVRTSEIRVAETTKRISDLEGQITAAKSFLQAAHLTLSAVPDTKPKLSNRWLQLAIGEFEREKDFEARRSQAKDQEVRKYKAALERWEAALPSTKKDLEEFEASARTQLDKLNLDLADAQRVLDAAIRQGPVLPVVIPRSLTADKMPLPKFNRETMTFGPIAIPTRSKVEFRHSSGESLFAQLEEMRCPQIQIRLPSLDAARLFKERFELGEIVCVVGNGVDYSTAETPIVVPAIVKEEETLVTGNNVTSAIELLFLLGMAASGNLPDQPMPPLHQFKGGEKRTVTVQQEQKIAGTKYHFTMSPETVVFVDRNQNKIFDDAQVTMFYKLFVVKGLSPDAQQAARVLQPGDHVVAVEKYPVCNTRGLQAAVRSMPVGRSFAVHYCKGGTDEILTFQAVGGRELGVIFRQGAGANSATSKVNFDKVIANFTENIRLDPKDAEAYLNRGVAYLDKGEDDKAIADFTEAIRLNPKDDEAYANRGVAYLGKHEHDKAITDFTEAIRLNPKDAEAYTNRSVAYLRKGETGNSDRDFARSRAIRDNPK